jgi:hypothetical protein
MFIAGMRVPSGHSTDLEDALQAMDLMRSALYVRYTIAPTGGAFNGRSVPIS